MGGNFLNTAVLGQIVIGLMWAHALFGGGVSVLVWYGRMTIIYIHWLHDNAGASLLWIGFPHNNMMFSLFCEGHLLTVSGHP